MTQKNQTALQKMQQIANRLISNTPQLMKMLDNDSLLKPKRPGSPTSKKNKLGGIHNQVNYNKNQMTSNDYHQKCKQLTNELTLQKDKCTQLEDEITVIKQRFVQRQIQYRKIIEQLQDQIKSKSMLDSNGADKTRMLNIQQLHKQIITNIGSIQNKTSKILIQQQSDIRRYFHKKINQIKEKFKQDKINKTEKDQQYQQKEKQMISQLQWIKNIAHKIDEENQAVLKKYSSLKAEFEIQSKDKEILLKQLLMKKKQNAVLKSQVEQYQKLLNEVSKQMQEQEVEKSKLEGMANQSAYGGQSTSKLGMANNFNSMKKTSTNKLIGQDSRTVIPKDSRIKDSRLTTQNIQSSQIDKKTDNTISHLKSILTKQKKKVHDLKNLYMKQLGSKTVLQKTIRKLVQDVRQSIIQVQKQRKKMSKKSPLPQDSFQTLQARQQLLQKLLSDEKILTLIYDRTFYAGNKMNSFYGVMGLGPMIQEIPEEIQQIMDDDQDEGFA